MAVSVTAPWRAFKAFVITSVSALFFLALLSRYLSAARTEAKKRKKTFKAVGDIGVPAEDEKDVKKAGGEKFDFIVVGGGAPLLHLKVLFKLMERPLAAIRYCRLCSGCPAQRRCFRVRSACGDGSEVRASASFSFLEPIIKLIFILFLAGRLLWTVEFRRHTLGYSEANSITTFTRSSSQMQASGSSFGLEVSFHHVLHSVV